MNKRSFIPFYFEADGVPTGGAADGTPTPGQAPGAGAGGNQPATPPPQAGEGETDLVKQLRSEAAAHRVESKANKKALDEALAKLKQFEDSGKSEAEKTAAELNELRNYKTTGESRYNDLLMKEAVTRLSLPNKLNIVDPEAALALVDRSGILKDGEVDMEVLSARLNTLLEARPYLKANARPQPPNLPPTNGGRGNGAQLTREMLKSMSPDEINKRWDEVQLLLKTN